MKFTHWRDQHAFTPLLPETEAFGQTHTIRKASFIALFENRFSLLWLYMQLLRYFRFVIWPKAVLWLLHNTLILESTYAIARHLQWVFLCRWCSMCRDDLPHLLGVHTKVTLPKHSVSTGCELRSLHQTGILWAMYPTTFQWEHAGTFPRDSVKRTM